MWYEKHRDNNRKVEASGRPVMGEASGCGHRGTWNWDAGGRDGGGISYNGHGDASHLLYKWMDVTIFMESLYTGKTIYTVFIRRVVRFRARRNLS